MEEKKEVKDAKKNTSSTKKTTKKKTVNTDMNRFADVISKMEEETKKVQNKKVEDKVNSQVYEVKSKKKDNIKKKKEKENINKKTKKEKLTSIETKLETIEMNIEKQKLSFKGEMTKIYKKLFFNILSACIMLLILILINVGYLTIPTNIFSIILKVFSMVAITLVIIMFEIAYKKDSGKLTVIGIEILILSVISIIMKKIYIHYNSKFVLSVTIMALLYVLYYIIKCIVIYIRDKRYANRYKNDIIEFNKKDVDE